MHHRADGLAAAVFDLDGTLIDTAPGLHGVLNRMLAKAGLAAIDAATVMRSMGDGLDDMVAAAVRAAGGTCDTAARAGWAERYLAELAEHDFRQDLPFAGVAETLAALRGQGVRLAVCTNKRQASAERVLDAQGLLDLFDLVVGEDRLDGFRKPDPRHLLAVLEGVDVAPDRAVMVGDHANDFHCARGAGVPVVLCSYGYSTLPIAAMGPDAIIGDFRELPAALARIAAR